jgi:hypothetical protein
MVKPKEIIAGQKECSKCFVFKDLSCFSKNKKSTDGYRSDCLECSRSSNNSRHRRKYSGLPARKRSYRWLLKTQYDLSEEAFSALYKKQKGSCKVCKEKLLNIFTGEVGKQPCVDHCHSSGKVRGILCGPCNSGIGLLQDSVELLRLAAKYLEEYYNNESST